MFPLFIVNDTGDNCDDIAVHMVDLAVTVPQYESIVFEGYSTSHQ